ncbi:MAG: hypothetical protein K1000chlam2_00571 [Chlamydiae bacterium]|nr:hypothetical protein [Chlamydiota bacterium]
MSVKFATYPTSLVKNNHDMCGVCQSKTKKIEWIAHPNEGQKHPYHKTCLKRWFQQQVTCPSCTKSVDPSSLCSSLKERIGFFLLNPGTISKGSIFLCTAIAFVACFQSELYELSQRDLQSTPLIFPSALHGVATFSVGIAYGAIEALAYLGRRILNS